ncbi:flavin reductase family protein [uncultured Amnibacterium sp.]|uniref:flavin reductase family protein n=1 Tax=uncultured Amnibacterium sp. TaxID=1631851 RepID=UPI0035CBCFA6
MERRHTEDAAAQVAESVDEAVFRQVLARFASGIVVVTGATDDGPAGLTCQSFSSLSLTPALVMLSTARTSSTWPRIQATGRFGVTVLADGQQAISDRFAVSGGDKFAGVDWRPGRLGNPLLAGALAHLECDVHAVHEGGDHLIVVGRVRALEAGGLDEDRSPLVYYRSSYRALAD